MKRIILSITLFFLAFSVYSADTYDFTSLDVKDGVPDNFIHEILRDEDGFMWFISGQVLSRYDGYDFKQYDLPTPGWHAYYILKEDRKGNIWLQSNDNYYIYDREKDTLCEDIERVISYPDIQDRISFLDVDYDGNIWFSVGDGNLIYYRDFEVFRTVPLPDSGDIKGLESRNGHVYLLLEGGRLYHYDIDKSSGFEHIAQVPSSDKFYHRMYLDTEGNLFSYIPHSYEDNLLLFDARDRSFSNIKDNDGKVINYVTDVLDDRKGNLWISTDNAGVIVWNKKTGRSTQVTVKNDHLYSLPSNHINCLYLDYQDVMWVGTSKRGVAYTCLSKMLFEKADYPGLDDISCVLEDNYGNIWCGTDGNGIMCEHKGTGRKVFYNSSSGDIPGDLIVCSFQDSKGRIWFGSYGNGVFYHEKGKFVPVRHHDPVKDEWMKDIRCINEDAYGNIWIGTIAYGLFCYESDGTFTDYTADNSALYSNGITDLYCRQERMLYVGTSSGVFVMDTYDRSLSEMTSDYLDMDESSDFFVTGVYKDSRGLLWMGGVDGVYVYCEDNGKRVHINSSNGLSHDYIRGICEDGNGNIWITTDVGVTNIIVVDDPVMPMPTFRCWRYYDEDGLNDIMFNPHSICCLDDGSVLMGGIGGLIRTDTSYKPFVSSWSNIEFTALYIADERVEAGKEIGGKMILKSNIQTSDGIVLDYSDNTFSIAVSSLNYPVLHKNHLMYRLEGHTDWLTLEGNLISFNRLHPDTYNLQVKVADPESPDGEIASLKIRINPPIWQSPVAYVVYVLLLCAFVTFLVIRIRQKTKLKYKMRILDMNISHQKEMDEAHMRFFTNISHDLRTPLSLIITPLEKLMGHQNLDGRIKTDLRHIHHNAELLMDAINQLLDFRKLDSGMGTLNLSHGNLTGLIKEVCKSFRPYSVKRKIRLNMVLTTDDIKLNFDKDKMRRILVNLLSNAYKFNVENGTITVSLDVVNQDGEEKVRMSVADTGIGISDEGKTRVFERFYQESNLSDNIGSGIGLNIVKEYVRMHGGTISVTDNNPKGTIFTLLFPYESTSFPENLNNDESFGQDEDKKVNDPEILIVEDNDNFRQFLTGCLKERYSVVEASNGKDALSVLEKHPVKLVISDIMMPKMSGLELCRAIKGDIRFSHIPVILLTAKTADDNILQGLKEGCDDYITKPFNLDILILRIEKLLEWSKSNHVKFKTVDVSPSEITITSLDEQLISKALKIVEENISNMDFTVDELSSSVGMTRGHLYKKLVAITGKTPLDFIRTIRIKRGRQLLEKSQLGVADVSYRVGLSPKQFAKYFKDTYGELPSEFRKRNCVSDEMIDIP